MSVPEYEKVYTKVKEWFDSAPDFARPTPADIVLATYNIIKELTCERDKNEN